MAVMGMVGGVTIRGGSLTACKDKAGCLVAQARDVEEEPCEFRFENLSKDAMNKFNHLYDFDVLDIAIPCFADTGRKLRSPMVSSTRGILLRTEDGRSRLDCHKGGKYLGSYTSEHDLKEGSADAWCAKFNSLRGQVSKDIMAALSTIKKRSDAARDRASIERRSEIYSD